MILTYVLAALFITAAITFLVIRNRRKSPAPSVEDKYYGNPGRPVRDLRAELPKLDYPYMWETWVAETPHDEVFHARLIDTRLNNRVLTSREVRLRRLGAEYRRWRGIENSIYRDDMLIPFSTWATQSIRQHCSWEPEVKGYQIG